LTFPKRERERGSREHDESGARPREQIQCLKTGLTPRFAWDLSSVITSDGIAVIERSARAQRQPL
jgi:hypothetical protein